MRSSWSPTQRASAPRSHSTSRMHSTSAIRGALAIVHGSSDNTAAAMSFKTAFLAPDIGSVPRNGTPPSITYAVDGGRPASPSSPPGSTSAILRRLYGSTERSRERDGHPRRRVLLVCRSRVRRAAWRRTRHFRLCGRQRAEPQLRAGLLGTDWACRGGPGNVRPRGHLVSGNSGGVLHHPRPDDVEPSGSRCGNPVPLGDVLRFTCAGTDRQRG